MHLLIPDHAPLGRGTDYDEIGFEYEKRVFRVFTEKRKTVFGRKRDASVEDDNPPPPTPSPGRRTTGSPLGHYKGVLCITNLYRTDLILNLYTYKYVYIYIRHTYYTLIPHERQTQKRAGRRLMPRRKL